MGFVRAWSTSTSREHLVPDHFFTDPRLSRGLTREQPVDEPRPTAEWVNADIEAYATSHGIDLAGTTKKADMLAAIEAATTPDELADDVPSPDQPITTNPSNTETPATGENQE